MSAQVNQPKKESLISIEGTMRELKKVQWPTKEQLVNYTIVTLFMVAVLSIFTYLIDKGVGALMNLLLR